MGTRAFIFALTAFAATATIAATPVERYASLCATCHLPGVHGAPQVGRHADWIPRLKAGLNTVYRNAIEGIPNTAMSAKGGHTALSDAEVRAVVDYMISATAVPAVVLNDAARYDRLGLTDRDFIRRDVSRDGYLSPDEVATDPVLARNLARFDADNDGRLSESEYRKAEGVLEKERIAVTVDDTELTATVRKALAGVKGIDLNAVKIEVNAGAVAVIGIVGDARVATEAEDALKRVAGVKTIRNRPVSGDQIGWD